MLEVPGVEEGWGVISENNCVSAAEKVSSLGKNWHRPCLRCERCSKTLSAGSHAEVRRHWSSAIDPEQDATMYL